MRFNKIFSKISMVRIAFLVFLIPICFACNNSKAEDGKKSENKTETKGDAAN